jgi:S-DNA-T family DNA segregation ATPase FtsK/SpoIIIE
VTGSPFVLMFALLSPLVAIATTLDARRSARRHQREESERFESECAAYEAAVVVAHARERSDADVRTPLMGGGADRNVIRVGVAPALSGSAPDEVLQPGDSAGELRVRALRERARHHPAMPLCAPRGHIAVIGDGMAADTIARRLLHEEGVHLIRLREPWPGAGAGADTAAGADVAEGAVTPRATIIRVSSATRIEVSVGGATPIVATPEFVTARQVDAAALHRRASEIPALPDSVSWRTIYRDAADDATEATHTTDTNSATLIGVDVEGPAVLDIVRDGPHALVGGTTGSGKSEFLRTLALAWVADRSPNEVQLLFVDFKGGATFAGLTRLPHVIQLVTDLDPLVAERTLHTLRAELRRRERVLAAAGLRDIAHHPGVLSRLVVIVDEFAAVLETFPALHSVFADLSARGRSLGVHLVLCTQSPAAVVRDAVATNCSIRVAFRLSTTASTAFLGAAGRGLESAGPGRARVVHGDTAREVQVAVIDDADIESVCQRWRDHDFDGPPWPQPLPSVIEHRELAAALAAAPSGAAAVVPVAVPVAVPVPASGSATLVLRFGLLDDPAEQRQVAAQWAPARDGALAVMGAPRSGRTVALTTLAFAAHRAGRVTMVLPPSLAEAWTLLEQCAQSSPPEALLLGDNLDLLLADSGERASDLLTRWDAAARALRRAGGAVVASMGSTAGVRSLVQGRFESRLILRSVDSDEHAFAGAPRGMFDRQAPAGRGWWAGLQVQVLCGAEPLRPTSMPAPEWAPSDGADVLIITRRPTLVADVLRDAYPQHHVVSDLSTFTAPGAALLGMSFSGGDPSQVVDVTPRILIGDSDAWQAAWSVFTSARRHATVVGVFADDADVRVLLGHRSPPPPLDADRGDVWVVEPGEPLARRRWGVFAAE